MTKKSLGTSRHSRGISRAGTRRSRYDIEVDEAMQCEKDRDLAAAAVRWIAASRATEHSLDRLAALQNAQRCINEAFVAGVDKAYADGYSWRDMGTVTDIPWQTLYRRYGTEARKKPRT